MISFRLNDKPVTYERNPEGSLLNFLREEKNITSVKDGCSGQAACGACLVEVNGKARLSCTTKMKTLQNAEVITLEGIPEAIKDILAKAFVNKGAVQCGFCTPGILMRTKILFQEKHDPTREEIKKALNPHLCRCTGYQKIIEAIESAHKTIKGIQSLDLNKSNGNVGTSLPKFEAIETAIGQRPFVSDLKADGMLHAALKFSDHPRAKILKIDISEAQSLKGVVGVFTASDIPGKHNTGLIVNDWPLMIGEGEITHYIGDVIAGVVAETKEIS